eukprot:9732331-Heterocapsa_arctica.AAC.1
MESPEQRLLVPQAHVRHDMHVGDHHGLASILPAPEQGDSTPHDVLLLNDVELGRELLADGCANSFSSRVVAVGGEVQESAI